MRIGIVTTWFERGAAYVSRAYMETLSAKHDVYIYARAGERYAQGDPKWDMRNVTWGRRVDSKPDTYIVWDDYKNWIVGNKLDMVLFNEQQSWEVVLRSVQELDVLLGSYVDYYKKNTVPLFWNYDFLLCNTKRHYGVFQEHPGAIYVPWGTDTEVYKPVERADGYKGVVFFNSCGMDPVRKGAYRAIRAFRNVQGDAKLIIHVQKDGLIDPAELSPADERIEIIEREVGAPGLYRFGDVYVYPTWLEGIGLTIQEALASGLPVITTDVPPMNEVVVEGVSGKLIEVEATKTRWDNYYWPLSLCSGKSLTAAMQYYVDNAGKLKQYKQRAREYAEKNCDWKKNSRELPELLEKVVKNPHRTDPELINKTVEYESSLYPRRKFGQPVRKFFYRTGITPFFKKIVKGAPKKRFPKEEDEFR